MVPLKQGSREWGCIGIRGVNGEKGEYCGNPTWNTYQKDGCAPLPWLVVRCWYPAMERILVGVCVDYLSLSAGVSCRIWSHNCGSWYLPKFLFKVGHWP